MFIKDLDKIVGKETLVGVFEHKGGLINFILTNTFIITNNKTDWGLQFHKEMWEKLIFVLVNSSRIHCNTTVYGNANDFRFENSF